jgi:hypothetical protein
LGTRATRFPPWIRDINFIFRHPRFSLSAPLFGLYKRYGLVFGSGMNGVCKVSLKGAVTRTRRGTGRGQTQAHATPQPGSTRNLTDACDAAVAGQKSKSWLIRTKSIRTLTAPTRN